MIFKELSPEQQVGYIFKALTTAVKVAKTLPKGSPKAPQGVFANISDRSIWDNWDDSILEKSLFSVEQYTICEEVICEWWKAFIDKKDGKIKELWHQLWVIFDDTLSVDRKCHKLGCKKSYIYKLRDQGVEAIRQYLIKK